VRPMAVSRSLSLKGSALPVPAHPASSRLLDRGPSYAIWLSALIADSRSTSALPGVEVSAALGGSFTCLTSNLAGAHAVSMRALAASANTLGPQVELHDTPRSPAVVY